MLKKIKKLVYPLDNALLMSDPAFLVLAFLKKSKIYIPLNISYEILFPGFVIIGAFSYSILMVVITNRIKSLFSPGKTSKIIKGLGYLLIFFSIYFLFFSLRAF